jgi:hypothetical protein
MDPSVSIASNVVKELAQLTQKAEPALSTTQGDLFISSNLPAAIITLRVPLKDYIGFLASLPEGIRPNISKIIPVEENTMIIINGLVTVEENGMKLDGVPTTIL